MSDLSTQLIEYLSTKMPDARDLAVEGLRRMPEGWSRESYALTLLWVTDEGPQSRELILRKDPAGSIVYTERETEDAVIRALHGAGFAVPVTWFVETGSDALGSPFLLMERLPGTSSPGVLYAEENSANRSSIGQDFIIELARLHTLDWTELDLPFSDDVPTVENAAVRVIDHWMAILDEQSMEPQPFLAQTLRWLRTHAPVAPRISLLHGDYRTGNFLFDGDHITGLVDWELASLGDPLQDLGWVFKTLWRLDGRICGFFEPEEFLRRYEEASGITVDRDALAFWEMFAEFQHSVYAVTGLKTHHDRTTDEINFAIAHLYQPYHMTQQARFLGI